MIKRLKFRALPRLAPPPQPAKRFEGIDWVPQCLHSTGIGPQILLNFSFYLNLDELPVANSSPNDSS